MTQADFDRFDVLMQGVAECYGQALSAQGIALRFKLLEPFSLPEVEKAALSIMTSRKYTSMPVPADFLEHISGGSAEDKAEVEAGKVLAAIGSHGAYASVVFDDAVTLAVIMHAYGGWVQLCQDCGVEESEHWFRKNFAKTWAAYSRQGVKQSGHLPGLFEITNCSNGYHEHVDPPKLVGDPAKARAVLEAGQSVPALSPGPENMRGDIRPLSGLLDAVTDARRQ
ncbi:DUF6475 domain-containing protein [Desulfovibrio sp. OttesenSCG-928-G15]|nr:DUF6475 domain-containing protein [Desulfovibrio sp. OttesenSCG-928-G15]